MQQSTESQSSESTAETSTLDSTGDAIEKVTGTLESWWEALVANLPNIAVAILVIVLFFFFARLARKLTRRVLEKTSAAPALTLLLARVVAMIVFVVGTFVALGVLGLDKTVTSLLAGAGVIGLVLGLAFQDIASDFLAGLVLALRRPFHLNDIIETHDHFGTVEFIGLRATHLRKPTGELVLVPNREVLDNPLMNYSRLGKRRVDLELGVSYGDDLEKARRLAIEAVEGVESRDDSRDVELFYTEFGDSSINFVVRFWIDFSRQVEYLAARSDAIMRIKKTFDDNDVAIPFPIRTLDFGVKGGENLAATLADWRQETPAA